MALSFGQLRKLFPAAARSCYLNAAAASPIALPVERAIRDHYREAVEFGDVGFGGWIRRKEDVRAKVAKLVGARPDEIAFTPSTSFGFSAVGRALRARGVREVLTLEDEFPSTTLPLLHAGLRLRVLRRREDGTYPPEDIEAALSRSTGAIAASAVQFASGFRLDVEAVGRICRARKLAFAVNAAQALGQVPIDVARAGADFLCATSHKWLMGGYGVGLFFARRGAIPEGALPWAGWLSVKEPMRMDNLAGARRRGRPGARTFVAEGVELRADASALEAGSSPWGPLFGLEAALDFIERIGVDRIRAHDLALQAALRPRLRQLGFVPNLRDDPEVGSGSCVFPVQGDARQAARALGSRGVVVSPRGIGLRVSTHAFNEREDLERFFRELSRAGVRPPGPEAPRARRRAAR